MKIKIILKTLLKEADVTASQLARATNIPVQTIHNWLTGTAPRNLNQVKLIADYFNVSVDYLCFGTQEIKQKKSEIDKYSEEINAGIFEVVLRRINKGEHE